MSYRIRSLESIRNEYGKPYIDQFLEDNIYTVSGIDVRESIIENLQEQPRVPSEYIRLDMEDFGDNTICISSMRFRIHRYWIPMSLFIVKEDNS